jgi:hypothetical protein
MKTTVKFLTLTIITFFITSNIISAEEKTKEYHEKWLVSEVNSLEINNRFGEVKVVNEGGSEITIDVEITVEAVSESAADKFLDLIEVNFSKSGSTVKAETTIDNGFKSQKKFSIDYKINIPPDKNLKISNQYGNTLVNKLNANGNFNIKYGGFSANDLQKPENGTMKLELAYGNASIDEANDLDVDVSYSPVSIDNIQKLNLVSKYSQMSIDEAGTIVADSKYDQFTIDKIESLSCETKYSHIDIDNLASSLKVEAGYGSVKVGEVSPGFKSISITNSYGQIALGMEEASYSIDASCEYCGISYPESEFQGNKMKDNNTREINGKVGTGNGGQIVIKSRYGDIKLKD